MMSIDEMNETNQTLRAKGYRLGRGMLYALTISTTILAYSTLLLHEPRPVSAATAAATAVEVLTCALLAVTAIVALLATTDHGRERADRVMTAGHVLAPVVLVLLLTHDQTATTHTFTEATLTASILFTLTQIVRWIIKHKNK